MNLTQLANKYDTNEKCIAKLEAVRRKKLADKKKRLTKNKKLK